LGVFKNTFPAPEKYLYTLSRRWRSVYMHLSGAGEAGETEEAVEVGYLFTPMSMVGALSL